MNELYFTPECEGMRLAMKDDKTGDFYVLVPQLVETSDGLRLGLGLGERRELYRCEDCSYVRCANSGCVKEPGYYQGIDE